MVNFTERAHAWAKENPDVVVTYVYGGDIHTRKASEDWIFIERELLRYSVDGKPLTAVIEEWENHKQETAPEQEKTFPRLMWVWENREISKLKKTVIYIFPDGRCVVLLDTLTTIYQHCAEIEEDAPTPIKMREMTDLEIFKALQDGALLTKNTNRLTYNFWISGNIPSNFTICYNPYAEDPIWEKLEVEA